MNGRQHIDLTLAVAERLFTPETAERISRYADFPDRVEDVRVEDIGSHLIGRNLASLTHFCIQFGPTPGVFRGYRWKADPSVPHIDLPDRDLFFDSAPWARLMPDALILRAPLNRLMLTDGINKAADEFTFPGAHAQAEWLGGSDPHAEIAGTSVHYAQDMTIREHIDGCLLRGHSLREARCETWWFKNRGTAKVRKMLDWAMGAPPMDPRAAVQDCRADTDRNDKGWRCLMRRRDTVLERISLRAMFYTVGMLRWWYARGLR